MQARGHRDLRLALSDELDEPSLARILDPRQRYPENLVCFFLQLDERGGDAKRLLELGVLLFELLDEPVLPIRPANRVVTDSWADA